MAACFGGGIPSKLSQGDLTKKANLRLELWNFIKSDNITALRSFLEENKDEIKRLSSGEYGVLSPFATYGTLSPLRYLFTNRKYAMMSLLLESFSPDISTCVIADDQKRTELDHAIATDNTRFIAIMLMFLKDDEKLQLIPKFQGKLLELLLRYLPHNVVSRIQPSVNVRERLEITAGSGRILDDITHNDPSTRKKIDAIIVPRQLISNYPDDLFQLEDNNFIRIINHDHLTYELIPQNGVEAFRLPSTQFPTYELRTNNKIITLEFLTPQRITITHRDIPLAQPEVMAMMFALALFV